jgi:ribosomal protein S18 acetylase RimI-like enzyme
MQRTFVRQVSSKEASTLAGVVALLEETLLEKQTDPERSGFLITRLTLLDLEAALSSGAELLVAEAEGKAVGYALLTSLNMLEEYTPTFVGVSPSNGWPAAREGYGYLFQVAIAQGFRRAGLAHSLLSKAKEKSPKGLVADVVIRPLANRPSLALFEASGFKRIGVLSFPAYPGLGPHDSAVFKWDPTPS